MSISVAIQRQLSIISIFSFFRFLFELIIKLRQLFIFRIKKHAVFNEVINMTVTIHIFIKTSFNLIKVANTVSTFAYIVFDFCCIVIYFYYLTIICKIIFIMLFPLSSSWHYYCSYFIYSFKHILLGFIRYFCFFYDLHHLLCLVKTSEILTLFLLSPLQLPLR